VISEEEKGVNTMNHSPFVTLEIFQFYPKLVFFVVRQHVNVLVSKPKFFGRVTKAIFIIRPIAVEVFSRITEIISPLDDL